MKNSETYKKYTDSSGEAYFCPLGEDSEKDINSEWVAGNCVEADVVGRYAGSINYVE